MEEKNVSRLEEDLYQLSRLSLTGRQQDIQKFIRLLSRRYQGTAIALKLSELVRDLPTRSMPLRKEGMPVIPVDVDSRLNLLRAEFVSNLEVEPIFSPDVSKALDQIIRERRQAVALEQAGLNPSRSLLFTGRPGVGKTLAAKWLARHLELPLLTLDLSAVMSSFLGRTGSNIRSVLDYAKSSSAILLLDEFDSIAKRRDDATEVGELKRLVTVLLQEIDDWPSSGILIAATNHSDLLDPAVWRRFEIRIDFPIPSRSEVTRAVEQFLGSEIDTGATFVDLLADVLVGASYSEIEIEITRARRAAAVSEAPLTTELANMIAERVRSLPKKDKTALAVRLSKAAHMSQRRIQEITGISRDTIRKATQSNRGDLWKGKQTSS